MLRNILILIGFVVALLPYLGFPHTWQTAISTASGLLIILLLVLSKRPRTHREVSERVEESPHTLHVERMEVEEHPEMHVERETVVDTERLNETPDTETSIEKQVTVVRRRRKKAGDVSSFENEDPQA